MVFPMVDPGYDGRKIFFVELQLLHANKAVEASI